MKWLFKPVLCSIGFHQIFVGIEENPPVMINRRNPYWQDGSLKPGPEIKILCIAIVSSPEKEPNFIPVDNAKLSIPELC